MPETRPLLSVCLPAYEMGGKGREFLKHSLDILAKQTFKDFEVVLSDYSKDDQLKDLCADYKDSLNISYFRNTDPRIGMASNTNNAITHAKGKLIKILFQDDFLFDETSLQKTIDAFDLEKDTWLVTGCIHTEDGATLSRPHYPQYAADIHLGNNRIGSPSVMTFKNEDPLLLDYNLTWLIDCDLYKRYFDKFGKPKLLKDITAVIRTGDHQITNTEATDALRKKEYQYALKKNSPQNLQLPNVTLVAVSSIKIGATLKALEISMDGINFHDALIISHEEPEELPKAISFKQCEPMRSIDDYSKFMAYDLAKYIETDYALVIQYDGYVARPQKWSDEFYDYDYIGAPWKEGLHFTKDGTNVRIGNGGFSFRSKKLLNALNEHNLPFTDDGTGFYNEDGILCVYYRKKLEELGIKYAPVAVASKFSHEADCPDSEPEPFGFHKNTKVLPPLFFAKHALKKLAGPR